MIHGIGTDIIEIERIKAAIERRSLPFLTRLFTERELERVKSASETFRAIHLAGRFAAKEAVVKALGCGFQGVDWKDIEIINDASGKPTVVLSEKIALRFNNPNLILTISHSKMHAVAFCIWQ